MLLKWTDLHVIIRPILFVCISFSLLPTTAKSLSYQNEGQMAFDYQPLMKGVGPDFMRLSPDRQWLVLANRDNYPSLSSESSAARIELLGHEFYLDMPLEVDSPLIEKVKLIHVSTGHSKDLSLPDRKIRDVRWAPDSESFALIGVTAKTLDIWRFNISQQRLEYWSDAEVSGQLESPAMVWLPDSQSIILRRSRMLSIDAITPPVATLQSSDAASVQTRLYRNTLDTDPARQQFSALLSQQAVLLHKSGEVRPLTSELLVEAVSISPDGRYLLVQHFTNEVQPGIRINRLAREYQVVEILSGEVKAILPKLQTDRQKAREPDAAPKGARLVQWRPDQPATVIWVESLEQEGHAVDTRFRDVVMSFEAPFKQLAAELFKTNWRLHQFYLTTHGRLIYSDFHAGQKQIRYWSVQLDAKKKQKVLLTQYDYTKRAEFPGELVTILLPDGRTQLISNKRQDVYFQAEGLHRWGDGVYLVRQGREAADQRIAFKSDSADQQKTPVYVRIIDEKEWLMLAAETPERAPFLQIRQNSVDEKPLYDWHSDDLHSVPKPELLEFKRSDGVQLYSQLYLPKKQSGALLPAVIWLYPREYHSHQQQPKPSQHFGFQLLDPQGPQIALLDGYAVVDASDVPIISRDGQEPNDTFMQQQQLNMASLIEALQQTGRIDTSRLVLMGHSYGAFGVLSLLTEGTGFRCAIARSGAYNRSLTPLGFQGEKRTLWQAPDLYQRLSPFFHADKIKTPVLLIHGLADENPGTAPLQSEMMFQALQAHQVPARLLLLKRERHTYRYRETIQQMLVTQSAWLQQCARDH